jgi:hypothetical protein
MESKEQIVPWECVKLQKTIVVNWPIKLVEHNLGDWNFINWSNTIKVPHMREEISSTHQVC